MIIPIAELKLADPHNGSHSFVNGRSISVEISTMAYVDGFLLSESVTTKPESNNPNFIQTVPTTFTLMKDGISTIYLWVRSVTDDVNDIPIFATIHSLPVEPTGTILLEGIVEDGNLLQNKVKIILTHSEGIASYYISETSTSDPIFNTQTPTEFIFSTQGSIHTAYVWLKDENNKTNKNPLTQTAFIPPDDIVSHRPGIIFLDENQQGLTHQSKNIRAVNKFGDYVQWNNIKFDPVGANFSEFRIDRDNNGYTIKTPEKYVLASKEHWDSIEVNLENRFRNDLSILYNRETIYTSKTIIVDQSIDSISITSNRLIFSPFNISGELNIIDLVSDDQNRIILQINDYDFCFLECILKNNPKLQSNYDAFSDLKLNFAPAESVPVSIGLELSDHKCFEENDFTFLTKYCQAEIQLNKKEINRLRDFGFPNNYFIPTELPFVPINETSIRIRNQNKSTSDPNPSFEFEVINPANSFAEFTIQIDSSPDFSSPINLSFRINENNGRVSSLEGPNLQEINFSDATLPPLSLGTIYWRVSRNSSEFTDPAILTIRTAPVMRLEFMLDSEFSKEIGTIAKIKIKVFDSHLNDIEGARVELRGIPAPTASNTDSMGIASFDILMPPTKQILEASASSEFATVTHEIEAVDSKHLESEISFDKNTECTPVNRYIIFRKLLAEIRSEDEDKILMISQSTSSPIIRRDTSEDQLGVKFDPDHRMLKMATDLLPPKTIRHLEITESCCNFIVEWSASKERGTTWHYDGKSASNQNILSDNFAVTAASGYKFDIISAGMANNKTISPYPYDTRGEIFPAYKLERISANMPRPDIIITETITNTSVIDTNNNKTFYETPRDVDDFSLSIISNSILLHWKNPELEHVSPEEFVYRVKSFDIAGNHSTSQIFYPPETIQSCLEGILITRINSTECFEQIFNECKPMDTEIELYHGSVLSRSLVVIKIPECLTMKAGIDYSLVEIGDENLGRRAKIVFNKLGSIDYNDTIKVCYKYGRAINCGSNPTPLDFIIQPYNGDSFSGNGSIEEISDPIRIHSPMTYTYGIWVKNEAGKLSQGIFKQILLDI